MSEKNVIDQLGDFKIIDPGSGGFKHVEPVPSEEELEKIYKEDYYASEKPLYIDEHGEDVEWWKETYKARFDVFERHLPSSSRTMFDIGSGPGYFLEAGRERNWNVTGIEPSKQAAEHSRDNLGMNIIEAFFDEKLAAALDPVDAVHSSQVLEHVPDPEKILSLAHSVLNPGGMICVVVPNDYNPLQKILRDHLDFEPWWLAPPHHLNYFDFDSLQALMEKCGFKVVERETTFPMELFLMMGDNYIGNDELGRQCHAKRKNLDLAFARSGNNELKQQLYRAFADQGMGREVVLYGVKV